MRFQQCCPLVDRDMHDNTHERSVTEITSVFVCVRYFLSDIRFSWCDDDAQVRPLPPGGAKAAQCRVRGAIVRLQGSLRQIMFSSTSNNFTNFSSFCLVSVVCKASVLCLIVRVSAWLAVYCFSNHNQNYFGQYWDHDCIIWLPIDAGNIMDLLNLKKKSF